MAALPKKIILWYLPTASGFRSVMLCPSLMTVRAERRYHLLKEQEQLKHSSNEIGATTNKVTTKYKK